MLSETQQKMIEDNHNIIYQAMHDMGVDAEEFYGICAIALCRAGEKYISNSDCKFSTYAYIFVVNAIKREFLHRSRKVRNQDHLVLRLQELTSTDSKDSFIDRLPAKNNVENQSIDNVVYRNILNVLDNKKKIILVMLMNGKTLKEIGNVLNMSCQAVDQSRKAIAKTVERYHLIERG